MYGAGAGAGIGGYYKGRTARLDARDRDVDREREVKMRETYDPMDLEKAMLTLSEAKRTGELDEFLHKKGIPKETALREDRSGRRRETREIATQGPAIAGINRTEEYNQAARQPNLNAIDRGEELAAAGQPGAIADVRFGNRLGADQQQDYDANDQFWNDFENLNRSIQTFRMTGNPKMIMDAYSLYMKDGIEATITKLPPAKKGGSARYRVETDNGRDPVEFESAEELAQATEQIFNQYMQANQPLDAYGIGPMTPRKEGKDTRTAQIKNADWYIQRMRGNPDFAGLSEQQLEIRAWTMVNYSKEGSPRTEVAKYFKSIMAQLMKGVGTFGKDAMERDEARKSAKQEAEWFRDTYYPDVPLDLPAKGEEDADEDAYQSLIDQVINPTK